jgi:signal transduction histidine kinase
MLLKQLGEVRINPVTLAFSNGYEPKFLVDYYDNSIKHIRIALLLGAFIYAIYGILDGRLDSAASSRAWFIRFCIVCPAIISAFSLTYLKGFTRIIHEILVFLVILCSFGIIIMMSLSSVYEKLYSPGIFVIIVYGCTFCRLRFIYSTVSTVTVMAAYEYFVISRHIHTQAELWNNSFHITSLVIIGMFASYHLEMYARRDYLQKLTIAEERRKSEEFKLAQEKDRIIKNLHDGIGGIITNINFLSEMDHHETERKEKALHAISDLSGECLNEIRTFISVCADHEKNWQTMFAEMRHFGCSMLESHDITLVFNAEGELDNRISDSLTAINLMRIYRETLANIVKHAMADKVSVTLSVSDMSLEMTVHDNGKWLQRNKDYMGRGLNNMEARTFDLDGQFLVDTTSGTQISVIIPLEA